ncbi:TIGR01777 family oxidoreductase [Desulfoluna butyratoxydans]|uniref:Polyketide cyclase / dehydrase and lipid transport n=1 Tax=Desulfoluna butyratoxydans TaxID=231438 RepID=A0A4U8YV08_9BACT|nr:TIGR01777 family oxidoreductase [Desulfoluna butyratoxydans]VFQ45762.1 polyketide cyclase / dehydrase and lipid transport [Desulfoluna butyratoxydans]
MHRRFIRQLRLHCSARDVFDWHGGDGVVQRLTPPWVAYRDLRRRGGLEEGATTSLTLKLGPLPIHWHSVHTACSRDRGFTDTMVRGPFASFEHAHRFDEDDGGCLLTDTIEYRLPLAPLSHAVAGSFADKELERMFRYRHAVTARDIASRLAAAGEPRLTIAVSGACGIIGSALVPWLRSQGHRVKPLVRGKAPGDHEIAWDPVAGTVEHEKFKGCDVLIHLAGENIGNARWTPAKRERIMKSRLDGTALLARAASRHKDGPRVFLSASAVGFYGDRCDEAVTEAASCGGSFVSEVCRRWEEAAAANWTRPGGRLVTLRIGVVLTPAGGALARLLPVFKAGLGGTFGSGKQYMSWVSMEDVLGAVGHILRTPALEGPVNLTAPYPVTNRDFARILASSVNRCSFTTLPAAVITGAFGEMGREVLLEGVKALPGVLEQSGYGFVHPTLADALSEVL